MRTSSRAAVVGGAAAGVLRAQAEGNGSRDGAAPRAKRCVVREPTGCVHRRRHE